MTHKVDWESALAGVNGNRSLLRLVIDAFLQESVQLEDQISSAISTRDAILLHRSGHTLKGCMMSLGAAEWCDPAVQIESIGASGTTDGARQPAIELADRLAELRNQLETFTP